MRFSSPRLVVTTLLGLADFSWQQNLSASYAPVYVKCPSNVQWVRPAHGLSKSESDWVSGRKKVVLEALDGYLERLDLEDFDSCEYVSRLKSSGYVHVPTLGFAISGGGYQSAFTGTAAMRAMDSRLPAANEQKTGGLLQALTYISGLSGGSYPTLSFAANNFPTADEIVKIWQPEIDRFQNVNVTTEHAATNADIFGEIAAKAEAGFDVGFPDYFGLGFSYEFIPGPQGGINTTMSNIATLSNFVNHNMPFPILQMDQIDSSDIEYFGLYVPYANSTTYEVSPFEFGAWTGPAAFTPTKYLGTTFRNGVPANSSLCVEGLDRASYMLGGASAALNFWYIEDESNGTLAAFPKHKRSLPAPTPKSAKDPLSKRAIMFPLATLEILIGAFQEFFGLNITQIAYATFPNPFPNIAAEKLQFVDASESGQAIPLWSQIQPARKSSLIIAWDDDQDAAPYSWNNGTSLYNTYIQAKASGIPFPVIPPPSTFIHNNYTSRPAFFGCDTKLTTTKSPAAPIIFYMTNSPYSAYTNFSFFQTASSLNQMADIFDNGFNQITQGNGTLDKEWPACLGCAVVERSLAEVGMRRTKQCERCFEKYCWDGTVYHGEVGPVDLPLLLDPGVSFAEWSETHDF